MWHGGEWKVCMANVSTLEMIQRLSTFFYNPLPKGRWMETGARGWRHCEEEGGRRWEEKIVRRATESP